MKLLISVYTRFNQVQLGVENRRNRLKRIVNCNDREITSLNMSTVKVRKKMFYDRK